MSSVKNRLLTRKESESSPQRPLMWACLALISGIILGQLFSILFFWVIVSIIILLTMGAIICLRLLRNESSGALRAARCWGLLGLISLSAVWFILLCNYVPKNSIDKYVTNQRQLVCITGIINGTVTPTAPAHGAFAKFDYRTKGTSFILKLLKIEVDGNFKSVSGKLLVNIKKADTTIKAGDVINVSGWLSKIHPPSNPGEFNYKLYLKRRKSISGRLALDNGKQLQILNKYKLNLLTRIEVYFQWFHLLIHNKAKRALYSNIKPSLIRSMLDSVLLGQKSKYYYQVRKIFTDAGLPDFMAISGIHLAIFLGLIWALAKLICKDPRNVGVIVLIALGVFLLIVPLKLPIIRAGTMALMFTLGYITSRKTYSLELLSLSAIIVLLFYPASVFTAGFQLSFGIVAGLIIFTPSVSDWFCPRLLFEDSMPDINWRIKRYIADFISVSLIAFLIAAPIAVYHFHQIHIWTFPMHVLSLFVFTIVLALGYLKIFIGIVWMPLSSLISFPLIFIGTILIYLADFGASLPLATLYSAPVAIGLAVAILIIIIAFFCELFKYRFIAFSLAVIILSGWVLATNYPRQFSLLTGKKLPDMTITMFDVGNGSCYLVQSGGKNIMFDCGSHSSLNIGENSIVPALIYFSVHHIDVLFISHADLDHFDGSLDICDQIGVKKVITTRQVLKRAENNKYSAIALLIDGLKQRKLPIETINRNWKKKIGKIKLTVLWPPENYHSEEDNNESIVLLIKAGKSKMLFSGDIQGRAMEGMFKRNTNLKADIAELPHHGSMVKSSTKWLKEVNPKIILQSTGIARLKFDKWKSVFAGSNIKRLISVKHGMCQVKVYKEGKIKTTNFLPLIH